jgi:hypothetical protein
VAVPGKWKDGIQTTRSDYEDVKWIEVAHDRVQCTDSAVAV